jgi:hypothetical protein
MSTGDSLYSMSSFGGVAAEDDAILDYFLSTDAAETIYSGHQFLVLGRKGSGKTALVRHFSEGDAPGVSRSLTLSGYPWNVHATRRDRGASDIEAYVSSWLYLIAVEFASLVLAKSRRITIEPAKSLHLFLTENYGSTSFNLSSILQPSRLKLSRLSFEPAVLGNKLGGISLERDAGDKGFGAELTRIIHEGVRG